MSPLSPDRAPQRSRSWIRAIVGASDFLNVDAHLRVDEGLVNVERLDGEELRRPATVAAATGARDRGRTGQTEDTDLAHDAAGRFGVGSAPRETADDLGRLAIPAVDRAAAEGVCAEVLLAPLLHRDAVLLGLAPQERKRGTGLGFGVWPGVGDPRLAGPTGGRADEAFVGIG